MVWANKVGIGTIWFEGSCCTPSLMAIWGNVDLSQHHPPNASHIILVPSWAKAAVDVTVQQASSGSQSHGKSVASAVVYSSSLNWCDHLSASADERAKDGAAKIAGAVAAIPGVGSSAVGLHPRSVSVEMCCCLWYPASRWQAVWLKSWLYCWLLWLCSWWG